LTSTEGFSQDIFQRRSLARLSSFRCRSSSGQSFSTANKNLCIGSPTCRPTCI